MYEYFHEQMKYYLMGSTEHYNYYEISVKTTLNLIKHCLTTNT